jgi:Subtilase family
VIRPLAFLDSGVQLSKVRPNGRSVTARDYSGNSQSGFGYRVTADHDERDHGTKVLQILDSALPPDVPIVSGRVVKRSDEEITVLRVACAYAHMVACDDPAVVNLSLAPRDDALICPSCGSLVPTEAFHSLILSHVFRIVEPRTMTVMAAGNQGRLSNARHFLAAAERTILVEASGSDGRRAPYSNIVDTTYIAAARCFGGDKAAGDALFPGAPSTEGTSFAAPFVAAAAYAYQRSMGPTAAFSAQSDFSMWCWRHLGLDLGFRPPSTSGDSV